MAGKPGPETKLIKKMRDAAHAIYGTRLVTIKIHGNEYARSGTHDLIHCLDGVFVSVEVKAPESYKVKGQPSEERALTEGPTTLQRAFFGHVLEAGGVTGFAASVEGYLEILAEAAYRAAVRDAALLAQWFPETEG